MCTSSDKLDAEDIIGIIFLGSIVIIVLWMLFSCISQVIGDNRVEKYKRVQQCIHKHEASKQICEDLYE